MATKDQEKTERRIDHAYAAMSWPSSIGVTPTTFLAAYINFATGASLATLGLIATIARVWDVVYSPITGVVTDRTRTRFGRRKPWVLAGYLLTTAMLVLGIIFLPERGAHFSAIWYAAGLGLFLTCMSTGSTAYSAHSGEITTDYDRRSRMSVRQGTIHIIAGLLSYGIPYLLVDPNTYGLRKGVAQLLPDLSFLHHTRELLFAPAVGGTANYGRVMIVLAWLTLLTTPVIVWRYMKFVPELPIPGGQAKERYRFRELFLPLRNRPFLIFCLGYLIFVSGYVGRISLYPFIIPYATSGGYSFLLLNLVQVIASIVGTVLSAGLVTRLERGQVMMLACGLEAVGLVLMGFSTHGFPHLTLIGCILVGLPGGTVALVPFLIASESADYTRMKLGGDTRGLHVSLIGMIARVSSFLATLVLALAGALGFNPKHGVSAHDVVTIQVLGLYAPAVLIVLGGAIMLIFPITRERHRIILRKIDAQERILPELMGAAVDPAVELTA